MPVDWSPLVELVRRSQHILLMTHVRPDADGLGSQLAFADALTALGKKPRVVIASKLPPRYEFLDPKREVIEDFRPEKFTDIDLTVVMDTGTWNQLGDFGPWLREQTCPKLVVDHHRTQDDLGAISLVDTGAEATGRLSHEIITALGVPVSARAAHLMFMAVAYDTGWFRHQNTTAATYQLAERLVLCGANPPPLYEQLFESASLARHKLLGVALARLQLRAAGKVAFTEVYLKDYADTGAVQGDTGDLINYPRSIVGVEAAVLFTEQPEGGTSVSLRARTLDVSKVAEQFNGGGHKLAAGARLSDDVPTAREKVLAAVEAALASVTR